MKNELLQKALQIQHANSINLKKNESNYAFTFIYPPSKLLYPINIHTIERKNINTAADELINEANMAGGYDNITVIIIN